MAAPFSEASVFGAANFVAKCLNLTRMINKETGLSKTVIVKKAIDMFFEHYKKTEKIN